MTDLVDSIVYYAVFLFSVTFHEASHAWAAKRGGDPTAYLGGQVSLDPIPHIRREPVGMVVLPVVSLIFYGWPFGFASAPYDPDWARRYPRRAAWMSLAGPGSNLALVLVAAALIHVGMAAGLLSAPDSVHFSQVTAAAGSGLSSAIALVVSVLFSMNLLLFVLNVIPVPPLDGSGALPLVLSDEAAERYQAMVRRSPLGLVGIVVAWMLLGAVWNPLFRAAVNLLYPGAHYG